MAPLDVPSKFTSSSDEEGSTCHVDCQLFGRTQQQQQPPKAQLLKETEQQIARDLYEMSLEEREGVIRDIHGVEKSKVVEELTFVQNSMNQLELELCSRQLSPAIDMAMKQSKNYVRSLYLMFLRRDDFVVKDAADRMIRWFEAKLELFGPSNLGKDITLDDLDKRDMDALQLGFLQLLPFRDRSGRAILCKVFYHQQYADKLNMVRTSVATLICLSPQQFILYSSTSIHHSDPI